MLVTAIERIGTCRAELEALFPHHFALLGEPMQRGIGIPPGEMPLAPDWQRYYAAEAAGLLFMVTLRDMGTLAGYWISHIGTGLHYAGTLVSDMDIWYLREEYRNGVASLVLGRAVKAELTRRGVKLWAAGEKWHRPAGRLYAALGMQPVEQYWAVWLGDK